MNEGCGKKRPGKQQAPCDHSSKNSSLESSGDLIGQVL
jgi:hypothetical protein